MLALCRTRTDRLVEPLIIYATGTRSEENGDFSPNRKDPMKREIRVSSDQKQINDLWDELREKFFVGGWNPPEKDD